MSLLLRRTQFSALIVTMLVAAPVRAQDGLLASARRLAAGASAAQTDMGTHVHRRSPVRVLGGVALIVAGAWTAFSYYDLEPTKTCGLSGMASNSLVYEDIFGSYSNGARWREVRLPDRYEFSAVMVDGTCKLQGVRHDGDWESYVNGRRVQRAVPYTISFATTIEQYSFFDSPSGYPYRTWRWTGGEGIAEAMTTYSEVPKTRLYSGIAMIGAGALLATLWADAPAPLNDLRVRVTPDGVHASRSFGF